LNNEYLKLLSLNDSEEYLSFNECQKVNDYLVSVDFSSSSISADQRTNVKDYVIQSLNTGSVQKNIIRPLEDLLHKLEAENT
jgi:hypothetical protein